MTTAGWWIALVVVEVVVVMALALVARLAGHPDVAEALVRCARVLTLAGAVVFVVGGAVIAGLWFRKRRA